MVATTDSAMKAEVETQSARRSLRVLVIAAGIGTSIIFVVAGVSSELQMFGDGSIFSYAVAAESAWSFHWHNISGRLFTYVFAYIPAEAYVALTRNAQRRHRRLRFAVLLGPNAGTACDAGGRPHKPAA